MEGSTWRTTKEDLAKEDMARQKKAMEQYHKKRAAQSEGTPGKTSIGDKVSLALFFRLFFGVGGLVLHLGWKLS